MKSAIEVESESKRLGSGVSLVWGLGSRMESGVWGLGSGVWGLRSEPLGFRFWIKISGKFLYGTSKRVLRTFSRLPFVGECSQ